MRNPARYGIAAAIFAALVPSAVLPACGGNGDGSNEPSVESASKRTFDPSSFGVPATGASRWLPLEPGTQTVRLGRVSRGDRRLTHRVVTTVTDVTKEIDGVRAVIVLDQDIDAGQVAEQAIDFMAEDEKGNVWSLGGYTEAYEGGEFVNAADAWLAGVNGAVPGILMPAKPRAGSPPFVQAKIPGDETSVGEVVETGARNCVPFKCFRNVVVVQEGGENKYFAPGVGHIRTEPPEGGGEQEVEELINFTQLSPRALSELSAEALKLDQNARDEASGVFGDSRPAKRTL